MAPDDPRRGPAGVALSRWVDRYTTRIDQELTNAWPDLADRLDEQIAQLSLSELALGPGEDFQRTRVEPVVRRWVERHVLPILEDAERELREIIHAEAGFSVGDVCLHDRVGGALKAADVLKGLALPGGVLLGGGAVGVAIATTTQLLVLTTVAVNWPLLVAGLLAGAALSWLGAGSLARLRQRLSERCETRLRGPIREALVGQGVRRGNETVPSLRDRLVQQVRDAAAAATPRLGERGSP
jgi:hypothetical protein